MPAPRVLLVMPDQWPRALLRAELRESGYDALGARDVAEALAYPASAEERGPVRLLVVDREALPAADAGPPADLLARHREATAILLTGSGQPPAPGEWRQVISRPVNLAEIVRVVRDLVPLPPEARHPLD